MAAALGAGMPATLMLPPGQEDRVGIVAARSWRRRLVVAMAEADRPSFLEILDNNGNESSSMVLRRKLREGSEFVLDPETVDSSSEFLRRRVIQGQTTEAAPPEEIEMEEMFSSETWKEIGRRAFHGGVMGGYPTTQVDNPEVKVAGNDAEQEPGSEKVPAVEHAVEPDEGAEKDSEHPGNEEAEFDFQGERVKRGGKFCRTEYVPHWKRVKRLGRLKLKPAGIYIVKMKMPQKQSDLWDHTYVSPIRGPVYGELVEKAYALAKNLKVNERLEDVLDSVGSFDTATANLLMQALGERGYTSQALSCFQWMRMHEPCLLDQESYPIIFSALKDTDKAEEALNIFNGMPETPAFHSRTTYYELIRALGFGGSRDHVQYVMEKMQMKGVEPDSAMFSLLITVAQKCQHSLTDVWNLFQSLRSKGITIDIRVYGNLVKAFCDAGRRAEALAIVDKMEKAGRSLSNVIYGILIDAYGMAGEIHEAEGLFAEMKIKGFHPDIVAYNSLIKAYGKIGQPEVCESLIQEVEQSGLEPDDVTYTALISAYGGQKMAEKAADAYLRMRVRGIEANVFSYTALIHAYCEDGWPTKAERAFRDMKREGIVPTVKTYTALMNGYKVEGDIDKVKFFWKEMKQAGCTPTRVVYNVLVDAFCKHGHYQDAKAIIVEFRRLGMKPDLMTYTMLMNGYARGGEIEEAEALMKTIRMEGFWPNAYTYTTLIYACLRVRDFSRAFYYHDRMCEAKQLPDRATYAKLKLLIDEQMNKRIDETVRMHVGSHHKMMTKGERDTEGELWKTKHWTQLQRYKPVTDDFQKYLRTSNISKTKKALLDAEIARRKMRRRR